MADDTTISGRVKNMRQMFDTPEIRRAKTDTLKPRMIYVASGTNWNLKPETDSKTQKTTGTRSERRRSSEWSDGRVAELKQDLYRRSLVSPASLAAKASYFQKTRGSRVQRRRLKSGAPYLGLGRLSYSSGDELDDDDDSVIDDRFEYWEDEIRPRRGSDFEKFSTFDSFYNAQGHSNLESSNHSNSLPKISSAPQPAVEETIQAQHTETTQSAAPDLAYDSEDEGNDVAGQASTLPRRTSVDQEDNAEYESPYSLHIVPVRENKLLKNELFLDRRRSRSVGDITVMLKIDNPTGLFKKARATRTESDAWTRRRSSANKPPIAAKPHIPKKPTNVNITTKPTNGKPVKKVTTPPTTTTTASLVTNSKPSADNHGNFTIATLQSHQNENDPGHIYDEVYQPQPQIKDLKKFFGTTPTPETTQSPPKGGFFAKHLNVPLNKSFPPPIPNTDVPKKGRKHSRNKTEPQVAEDTNPYAVSQPLHPSEKSKEFVRKKKASQTSADRSGDSGIAPGIQMLEVPKNRTRKNGGSTKSEDSDFGSTASDSDDSDSWDSFDSGSDSQQAPIPINFVDESHKVAYEVLTSERTYVDRLNLLDQSFLARIERENEKARWFSHEITREIFSNLRSIYAFHHNFLLPDLENRLKEWEVNPSLGDILKRLAPFLKLYSDYVSNFDNAVKLLNTWTQKQPKFGTLLQEIQRRPECMNLALQHHMLEPVQRIPRYELLLKDYLKRLPGDSKDRKDAEEALERIAQAAHHSNDMMKTTDQFQKLLKLNEKIEGEDIIDPSRQLLKEGKIIKISARGGNKHQDMYLFLFNDMMLCCIRSKILKRGKIYTVKNKLDVDGMKILDSEDCRFRVESKQKSLELKATSEEEKEEWMKSIISTVHEMHRKKQTFINNDAMNDRPASEELCDSQDGSSASKRQETIYLGKKLKLEIQQLSVCELGMRAPRWIKDEEVTMCMRCGTDFKAITRRRHHCRACGAVVCNKCSSYEAQLPYDDNKVNRVCYKCFFTFKGEEEGAKEQMRREKLDENVTSLITEIDEENSYSSFLNVLQKREWVRYWVVATKQDLFALKAPKDVRPVLTIPIKLYKICEISDADNVDRPHAFKLSDSIRSQHVFAADSKELKKKWLMVFNEGLEQVLKTKYMTI